MTGNLRSLTAQEQDELAKAIRILQRPDLHPAWSRKESAEDLQRILGHYRDP